MTQSNDEGYPRQQVGEKNLRKTHIKLTNTQRPRLLFVWGNNAYKLDISRASTNYGIKNLFGFRGQVLVLVVPVTGHCFLIHEEGIIPEPTPLNGQFL